MQIQRRGPQQYYLRWSLPHAPGVVGRRIGEMFHGPYDAAKARWIARAVELRIIDPETPRTATVADLAAAWLAEGRASQRATATRRQYAGHLRRDILPLIGHERVDHLTTRRIAQLVADWERQGKGVRTITLAYATLYRCLQQAVAWHWLAVNPAVGVDVPAYRPAPHTVWTAAEAARFLRATGSLDPWGPFYRLAILTGLRLSELIGLTWSDVDWERRVVRVRQQYTVDRERKAPKSARGERWLPVDTGTLEALRRRQVAQARQAARLGDDWPASDWVFTTKAGTPLMHRNVRRRLAGDIARHWLPPLRVHDLRATGATLLAEAGASERVVADRLGHAETQVTREHYLRLAAEVQRAPVDAVARALGTAPAARRWRLQRRVAAPRDTPGIRGGDTRDTGRP